MRKYIYISIALALMAAPARAQFLGYTSPQTVAQQLATNTSCTGGVQNFTTANIGQTQHYATGILGNGITSFQMSLQGIDISGFKTTLSDTAFNAGLSATVSSLTGSGYYPIVQVVIICNSGGVFSLSYSGSSAAFNALSGSFLQTAVDKTIWQNQPQNASTNTTNFSPPFGTTRGKMWFSYVAGSIAGSSLGVQCSNPRFNQSILYTFQLANTTNEQIFSVPGTDCAFMQVIYTSGGASAFNFNLDYFFDPPGTSSSVTSGTTLGLALNEDILLTEKGARWDVPSAPAAGSQGTASKAAGTTGVRHVSDCVSFSAGAIAAPAATTLTVNLRDGASGAGTIIWTQTVAIPATAAPHYSQNFCGLNLIGTAATAMTLEFSAALANESESVTLTGYDVQ